MTPAADPAGDPRPLVDTPAAAEAPRTSAQQLTVWADAGIFTPAGVDPDGSRWWSLHDLRRDLATDIDGHRGEDLPR
jgi:hypothetical protein